MVKEKQKDNFQTTKIANSLAIGGMIGAGKSTLSRALGDYLNIPVVYELKENDSLQDLLIQKMYEGNTVGAITFQVYFFWNRFENYKLQSKSEKPSVFDRTIFEDRLFAYQNMIKDPVVFKFYEGIWNEKAKEMIYSVGVPKLYIILDIKWEDFKKRLFERGRKSETDNFDQNEAYFRAIHDGYTDYLVKICKIYQINYMILDATIPTDKQVEMIMAKIKQENISF